MSQVIKQHLGGLPWYYPTEWTTIQEKLAVVQERRRWTEERRDVHAGTAAQWMLGHRLAHLEAEERWIQQTLAELGSVPSQQDRAASKENQQESGA